MEEKNNRRLEGVEGGGRRVGRDGEGRGRGRLYRKQTQVATT